MRSERFIKNLISGFAGQGINILLKFISRTVFIYVLGKEFLGISSLFTNILTVLNLAELGLGNAIVFQLYKPLAREDRSAITAHMNYLKRAYRLIGIGILGVGLILVFFLPYIMTGTTNLVNVKMIFILYVFQTVSSYWFWAYKRSILQADQKTYVINLITYLSSMGTALVQILCLFWFQSFYLYTVLGIASNILTNYLIAKKADQIYPFIKEKNERKLSNLETKEMLKNIVGISMYKINSVIVRSTDNIVISVFINTISVGIYDNYHMIASSVLSVTKTIFSSATAGIGNLHVTETKEKKEEVFKCISFFCFWIYGECGICLWVLLNPFIKIWLDGTYLLSTSVVLLIVIDFVMDGFQNPSLLFKDGCGLFWQGKFRPMVTAILNLIISILLVRKIGIAGVVVGTLISRFTTTWWFEPWLVYRHVFKKPVYSYFIRYGIAAGLTFLLGAGVTFLCMYLADDTLTGFVVRMLFSLLLPNIMVIVMFHKTKEFKYVWNILSNLKIFNHRHNGVE